MQAVSLAVVLLAALGHAAFWVGVVNRWHAIGLPRPLIKSVLALLHLVLVAPFAWAGWVLARYGWDAGLSLYFDNAFAMVYGTLAAAFGAVHLLVWGAARSRAGRLPPHAIRRPSRIVDVARHLGFPPACGPRTHFFRRIPGNQLWQLHAEAFELVLPSLPAQLDGLAIGHWSDLHLSGRLDRGYYRTMVELTCERPLDLLALTGDVCDDARCIDWIGELFSDVAPRLGKYFILGNHDLRTRDVPRLRAALRAAGFVDVGGQAVIVSDTPLLVAGDERPWFRGEPSWPPVANAPPWKLLLAHTPDRIRWARARGFDLMLAGHTHGGQVCFPLIGPIVCPSWHGTRYACGWFDCKPTLMHVSRGTGSLFPLRLNCTPEITHVVLRAARCQADGTSVATGSSRELPIGEQR